VNRALALFALLAFAHAHSADDAPASVAPKAEATPRFVVLVINPTFRGQRDEVLAPFGIARLHGWSTLVKLERDLQRIVERKNLYESLLAPTVCPGAGVEDPCPAVRRIDDVQLPEAIAALQPSRILLVQPMTGYWKLSRHFFAELRVHVIGEDGRRVNTFEISYADRRCDAVCVETSFAAAARELAAMLSYTLEVDIGYRTTATPAAWRAKGLARGFAQWANRCDKPAERDLLVRQYGLRLWIHPVSHPDVDVISLQSLPWQGCNTLDLQ
jgi:hypothetical protein